MQIWRLKFELKVPTARARDVDGNILRVEKSEREIYTFSLVKFIFSAQSDRDPRKVSSITVAEKKQLYAMSYGVKSV